MKTQFRKIEPDEGFYAGDGLEDMYRPSAYTAIAEANMMSETNARYGNTKVVVSRSFRRYTHS